MFIRRTHMLALVCFSLTEPAGFSFTCTESVQHCKHGAAEATMLLSVHAVYSQRLPLHNRSTCRYVSRWACHQLPGQVERLTPLISVEKVVISIMGIFSIILFFAVPVTVLRLAV